MLVSHLRSEVVVASLEPTIVPIELDKNVRQRTNILHGNRPSRILLVPSIIHICHDVVHPFPVRRCQPSRTFQLWVTELENAGLRLQFPKVYVNRCRPQVCLAKRTFTNKSTSFCCVTIVFVLPHSQLWLSLSMSSCCKGRYGWKKASFCTEN